MRQSRIVCAHKRVQGGTGCDCERSTVLCYGFDSVEFDVKLLNYTTQQHTMHDAFHYSATQTCT